MPSMLGEKYQLATSYYICGILLHEVCSLALHDFCHNSSSRAYLHSLWNSDYRLLTTSSSIIFCVATSHSVHSHKGKIILVSCSQTLPNWYGNSGDPRKMGILKSFMLSTAVLALLPKSSPTKSDPHLDTQPLPKIWSLSWGASFSEQADSGHDSLYIYNYIYNAPGVDTVIHTCVVQ